MCGQFIRGLLIGLLGLGLGACGSSSTPSTPDARPPRTDTAVQPTPTGGIDAGCDEDAVGENGCIINPADPSVGGGTVVTRQNPVPYSTCK
jgi:hypothetical protein